MKYQFLKQNRVEIIGSRGLYFLSHETTTPSSENTGFGLGVGA